MGLDRISDRQGRHTVTVASVVKDNSVMRDGRIKVGDRITHINSKAIEVSRQRI
jgi:C-terminal processing protease CtpA/Prc